jgi:hypothetical protein
MEAVEEYVPVYVSTRHLSRVYAYVAALDEPVEPARVEGDRAVEWPRELIEKQFRQSPQTIQALQRHLAANPGQEFTTYELAEVMGLEYGWNSVAGALGAYGRRIRNRHGRDSWPFSVRYSYDKQKHVYSMTKDVAEIIASL